MSKKREKKRSQECNCPNCQKKSGKLNSGLGDNPFGINPTQLMGLLGNVDMGKIGNILSSMNKDGFDLNNLNLGSIQNMMSNNKGDVNNQNLSAMQKMMAGMGIKDNQGGPSIEDMIKNMGNFQNMQKDMNNGANNNTNLNSKQSNDISRNKKNRNGNNKKESAIKIDENIKVDENIDMLLAIKKIVNYDKAKFIDKIIELYNNGEFEEDDE